jgi:hypothetical protein
VIFIDRECLALEDSNNSSWNDEENSGGAGQKRSHKQMISQNEVDENGNDDVEYQLNQCPESSNSNIENSNILQNTTSTRLKRQKVNHFNN